MCAEDDVVKAITIHIARAVHGDSKCRASTCAADDEPIRAIEARRRDAGGEASRLPEDDVCHTAVELWPVRYVNDPRVISNERGFVSINATLSVDFLGQCASETIDGRYYSSSGGQNDFARGAAYSRGGQGFVVLHSTTSGGASRIVSQLTAGDAVTTPKNTVDKVVTEFGVAELRGRSIRERTHALIAVAHPEHRDRLTAEATAMCYI